MPTPNRAPIYPASLRHGIAVISTANTNRDGSGTMGTVLTADATVGSRVVLVRVKATAATTAGMVRLYVHDGSNARLVHEIAVSAITPSGTVASFAAEWVPTGADGLLLPAGYSLRASTHNAEEFVISAEGGDF